MLFSDKRFTECRALFKSKPYERQKDSLEMKLLCFLRSLAPLRRVSAATFEDIVKLLISKDAAGKRRVHLRPVTALHA